MKEWIQEIQKQHEIEKRITKQKKETFNETSTSSFINRLSNEENCRWMTPVEKIQDDLNILQENKESSTTKQFDT